MVRLFSSVEHTQFWVFGGACLCLVTSCCRNIGFCIALCVVLALNPQAIPGKDCTSAAFSVFECKHPVLPFTYYKVLLDTMHTTQNLAQKWGKKWPCSHRVSDDGVSASAAPADYLPAWPPVQAEQPGHRKRSPCTRGLWKWGVWGPQRQRWVDGESQGYCL